MSLQSSSLEFKLHQLAFMTIIEKGVEHQTEAVAYARANFGQFADKYEKGFLNHIFICNWFIYLSFV